jgi:hypothetical protein
LQLLLFPKMITFIPKLFVTMKLSITLLGIFLLNICLYGQGTNTEEQRSKDESQIRKLMIQVMKWHDKNDPFIGYYPIFDPSSGQATGMDLKALQEGLNELKDTEFFDPSFIATYRTNVRSLHTKIQNKEVEFAEGDLAPYAEADPWCDCQDVPSDFRWDDMYIKYNSIDKNLAEITWTWDDSEDSQSFSYAVKMRKMRGKWKITYLQGFDTTIAPK